MSLQTPPAVSAGGTPPAAPPSSSRGGAWVASWRVALRLARRDVRRHRGRSIAALVMIGVPTLLISVALVVGATSQIAPDESVSLALGPAQASVATTDAGRITQGVDPVTQGYTSTTEDAREIPGMRPGASAQLNASVIGDLAGDREAIAWSEGRTRVRLGDRDLGLDTLAVSDPRRLDGKIRLRSGRWPTAADEVLASPLAVRRGIPESGQLHLAGDDEDRVLTVVGTATATTVWGGTHELVATTPDVMREQPNSGWYLLGDSPVTWEEVVRLNEYGLTVFSADVVAHPPSPDTLDPALVAGADSDQAQVVALGATLLLIVIALLVGPAFAVGATRQRRTLALAASNGATASQLRRTVLAHALVLGGLSALVGAALAVPVGWVATRLLADRTAATLGPFEVPWWQLAALWAIAVLAAVAAALAPARRLTRLDIVGAMRGRVVTPPPSRWLFVLGLGLVAVGGAGVIVGLDRNEFAISFAALLLVLGALLLVPRTLHALGRLAGPLPLPLRLALRDLARHRTRSAPTVAAVLAGSAALTMGLIGASSDDAQGQRDYVPRAMHGEAIVGASGPAADVMAPVHRELPQLVTTPVHTYGAVRDWESPSQDETVPEPFIVTVPDGCTTDEALQLGEPVGDGRCTTLSSGGGMAVSPTSIAFMPADEIIRRFDLTGAEARTVSGGGGLLVTDASGETVVDGRIAIARGSLTSDPDTGERQTITSERTERVPVVVRPFSTEAMARSTQSGLVLPTERAERADWPVSLSTILVREPGGMVDEPTQERLQQLLGDETYVEVERGWGNPLALVIAVILGLFTLVLVVVTLTATALGLAEQERDQATIAAVGGDRRTRRLMVAGQTWLLATLGVVLGLLVGSFPGITLARALTSEGYDPMTYEAVARDATIVIPWLPLVFALVAVPLLAATLAGLGIRRTPDLTRRTQ